MFIKKALYKPKNSNFHTNNRKQGVHQSFHSLKLHSIPSSRSFSFFPLNPNKALLRKNNKKGKKPFAELMLTCDRTFNFYKAKLIKITEKTLVNKLPFFLKVLNSL
ncbi:MAG: hypothetical protein GY817_02075 [bacterium]|nr:hypothetical protein [bacterium]